MEYTFKEDTPEALEVKTNLREKFTNDKTIYEDGWIFLDGLAFCGNCYKPYPICKGWCSGRIPTDNIDVRSLELVKKKKKV